MLITDLPTETLARIGQHLDHTTLSAFSLVQSRCRSCVVQWLFRHLVLENAESAAALSQMLEHTTYAKYVRSLTVDPLKRPIGYDSFSDPIGEERFEADRQAPRTVYEQDSSWLPVSDLIGTLPMLEDLVWRCPQQFPPCILRAFSGNQSLSSCRLHLRTFRLRSLQETRLDSHELALIQSPHLHSVWFTYNLDDTCNNDLYLPEVVARTVRGLATNLRCVRLWQGSKGAEPFSDPSAVMHRLEDFTSTLSHIQGALSEFHLTGGGHLDEDQIAGWAGCTDFSTVESLILQQWTTPGAVAALTDYEFVKLRTLSMNLEEDVNIPDYECSDALGRFLCKLPFLSDLGLQGQFDRPNFSKAIIHHANTITRLHLSPAGYRSNRLLLGLDDIRLIQRHCALLTDLRLTIMRSKGDEEEVKIYRAIGRISRLQKLHLTLNASNHAVLREPEGLGDDDPYETPYEETFDNFDMELINMQLACWILPRKCYVRDMMINSALDQSLAKSIFMIINDARPERSFPLVEMQVQSEGGGDFGNHLFSMVNLDVFKELECCWLIKRRMTTNWKENMGITKTHGPGLRFEPCLSNRLEPIFRRLWPPRSEFSRWKDDWHSFPLCIGK